MTPKKYDDLPSFVTFAQMARILREKGLDPNATADTVRYRARTDEKWPVGEGKKHEYEPFGNARAMPPGPVLELYESAPPSSRGRGPDKKPRKRRETQ